MRFPHSQRPLPKLASLAEARKSPELCEADERPLQDSVTLPPPPQRPAELDRGLSAAFDKQCNLDLEALDNLEEISDPGTEHDSFSGNMSSSSQAPESWISAFCSLVGHEYFAEVSEDFIEDDFNLTGLQSQVPMYKEALEMILDVEPEDLSDEEDENEDEDEDEDDMDQDGERGYRRPDAAERRHLRMASDLSVIESSAEMLYGLIHQRFITSRPGIQQMAEKYELGHFGHCPRVHCGGAKVLPVGCSDIPGQETVKLFCPSCLDVYNPPNSRFQAVDGAFFGTTFGCLFFMTFPELDVGGHKPPEKSLPDVASPLGGPKDGRSSLSSSLTSQPNHSTPAQQHQAPLPPQPDMINGVAPRNLAPGLGLGNIYEPRIYGFRVSEFAKTGPRMKWLRSRPADVNELDECRIWAENQEAALQLPTDVGAAAADLPDSEMADEAIAGDNGEAEDEDMDRYGRGEPPGNVAPDSRAAYPTDATQRKKQSSAQGRRRDRHDVLPNGQGSGGGTALSVGGAG